MSAGVFKTSKYADNSGIIYRIRIQEETEELVIDDVANDPPTGSPLPGSGWARVSGGTRQLGVYPRKIAVKFTGGVPAGYKEGGTHYVPVLKRETLGDYTVVAGLTGTYLGHPVIVVGMSPERKR